MDATGLSPEITRLLQAGGHGDPVALERLTLAVCDELRPIARPGGSLKLRVIELRFFVGPSPEETAEALKISRAACCAAGWPLEHVSDDS